MSQPSEPPKCFVSYTWDSSAHKSWVRELARQLTTNGVEVILDQWDLKYGDDLPHFMETSVRESDFVILVCTPDYARKSNQGTGGAGYEKRIVTGEMYQSVTQSKFIPLLRRGSNKDALPTFLKSKNYLDFRNDSEFEMKLKDLIRQIHGVPEYPRPKLGPNPFSAPKVDKEKSQDREQYSAEGEWDIEESFDLEPGERQEIPVKTKAGSRLVGFVEADGKISAYLLTANSFRSFDDELEFNYLWGREDVKRTKVSYDCSDSFTRHFVVSNGYEVQEDENYREAVSVEVKLRIETPEGSELDRPILR